MELRMASMDKPFISDFYKEKDIFITGATGFMGKVLLEKLLRSCGGLRRIFVLMRAKGGASPQARLDELLDSEIFQALRCSDQNFARGKVIAVEGDLTLPELGLSAEHRRALLDNVDIVFHSAAIVKFDEPLKSSIDMNVLGTRRLLQLCQGMSKLKALVHVSTAYCNCDKEEVAEVIYPPPFDPQNVIDAVSWMDDPLVEAITPKLLGSRPNMYTFTKALAESLVADERGSLPVAIVRPSIVTAAWQEPIPGWIDNINGPTGLLVASGKGLLRSMVADTDKAADFVPVDVVINTMIMVAWHTAMHRPDKIAVYHVASGTLRKLTWGDIETIAYPLLLWHPMPNAVRHPGGSFKKSRFFNALSMFFEHRCPALLFDAYLWLSGRKPKMLPLFNKLYKVMVSLEYFTTHEWRFHSGNLLSLLQEISPADRKTFCADLRLLDWGNYFKDYVVGTRKYVLKEDPSTVPDGRNALRRLYIYQQLLYAALIALAWRLIMLKSKSACRLWHGLVSLFLPLLSLVSSAFGLPYPEDAPPHSAPSPTGGRP
ncbi:fatty acyl-CoA reductase 1-like [Dermacentor variabilis]|uniref:fatty acyl-CoA reductase 1-like n=1 Tax=Dermacentor variabilis TaxID=34621 RepID=UPI003F5BD384